MMEFNNFNPNINFTYEFSEASINFLDLNVKFSSDLFVCKAHRLPSIKSSQTHKKVNSI